MADRNYRADIDGLRAVAVVLVLLFHFFPHTVPAGFVGVDVFFVISGFVITGLIQREMAAGTFTFGGFMARRVCRLFPALLLVLVACIGIGWATLFASEYMQLGHHLGAGSIFVSNIAHWAESGYFDNKAITKPLWHLWSLAIEMQFYLVWPLVLMGAMRIGGRAPERVTVLLLMLSFGSNIMLMEDPVADFYAPYSRGWELLLGALVAMAAPAPKRAAIWMSIGGLVMFGFSLVLITAGKVYPGVMALLPTFGTALLIASAPRLLTLRPLIALGKVSYSLYLWHWPLLSFGAIVMGSNLTPTWRFGLLALSLLLATMTYRWVEMPMRYRGVGMKRVNGLVAAMIAVGVIGVSMVVMKGYPDRPMIASYADNAYELVHPIENDWDCRNRMRNSAMPFEYCRFQRGMSEKQVAVIGDSFAHAAFEGFSNVMVRNNYGVLLIGAPSCPLLKGEKNNPYCPKLVDVILKEIAAQKEVTDVVINFHGSEYLLGSRVVEAKPIVNEEQFIAGLQGAIDQLKQAGKRVYFIIENPVTGIQAAECIARPFRPAPPPCIVPREEIVKFEQPYRDAVAKLTGVTVMDTLRVFCPNENCEMMQAGRLMYADDAHLSYSGSMRQARAFEMDILRRYEPPGN